MKLTGLLWIYRCFRYALIMIFKEISLEEINCEDETFRVSEELDSVTLLNSLREIGQLNPVVLRDETPGKVIVCGFRRIRALRQLGHRRILAQILPTEANEAIRIFRLALWDNLSHRQFSPLEKARALFKLEGICGVPAETLIDAYLPLLGLAPHESILRAYLALNHIQSGLHRCLTEDRLTLSSIEILSKSPACVQDSFSSLMDRIRLSASSQKKVLGLLEDLSAATGASLDAPLCRPEAKAILDDSRLSLFQKGEKLHGFLYRLRNPRLSQALERFQAHKKLLGLPGAIRLSPHPFFETEDLHVEFDASNPKRFRELASALQKAMESPELDELFHQADS